MTPTDRIVMARRELAAALEEARPIAKLFVEFTRAARSASDVAEAATELHMKAGRVALFATILAREFALEPKAPEQHAASVRRPARKRRAM